MRNSMLPENAKGKDGESLEKARNWMQGRLAKAYDFLFIVIFIVVASLIFVFGKENGGWRSDADSLLTTFMSMQKLTWYYWEQDRFANLLPLLASPFRDVEVNLNVQLFLRNVSAFLSVFFVLLVIGDRDLLTERFMAAVLVMMVVAAPGLLNIFGGPFAQPISCAVFALGLWVSEAPTNKHFSPGRRLIAITLLFWISFLVSISLLVIVIPISIACWLLRSYPSSVPLARPSTSVAVIVSAAAAYLHSTFFRPHTPLGLNFSWHALNDAAKVIIDQFNVTILAALLLACGTAAGFSEYRNRWRGIHSSVTIPLPHLITLAVVTAAALHQLKMGPGREMKYGFAVIVNKNDERYYFVIAIILIVIASS